MQKQDQNKYQDNPVKIKPQASQSSGSLQSKTVNIVFVGAGPATLGLLCNAQKTSRLQELITQDGGIAILEKGESFGGGMLQYYGINSNTSSNGFLKCVFKKKTLLNDDSQHMSQVFSQKSYKSHINRSDKKGVNSDLQDVTSKKSENSEDENAIDSERDEPEMGDANATSQASLYKRASKVYSYQAYQPFRELVESDLFKHMSEYGSQIIPLSLVGIFMNYVGNHLLNHIFQQYKFKVFYGKHKVTSIQLLANGDFITMASRKVKISKKNEVSGQTTFVEQEQLIQFRSRAVVVSNGGKQSLHPSFYKSWFPFMKAKKDRVLLSDKFMRKDIYKQTMDRIKSNKLKNIVIIGGSASGWSTAWLLLNGPATYYKNNSIKLNQRIQFPSARVKSIQNCKDCCQCEQKHKKVVCQCECICFGNFSYSDWEFDYSQLPKHFENGSIKIIYRDKIKVFYPTVSQAKADGYTEFDPKIFSRKDGYLYSYTGLRGNAKTLYKKVKSGAEKRIKLVNAITPQDQAKHVDAADLVIWSCGYQTNKIVFKDHEGKEISISQRAPQTQFDVDAKCRIATADGCILTKTFGTGIAYPTKTNDGMQISDGSKPKPRADSFSLYCNWVANRVLLSLLQNNLLSSKIQKTMKSKLIKIQDQQHKQLEPAKQQLKKLRVKSVANLAISKLKKEIKENIQKGSAGEMSLINKPVEVFELAQSMDGNLGEMNIDNTEISVTMSNQKIFSSPKQQVKLRVQSQIKRNKEVYDQSKKKRAKQIQSILKIEQNNNMNKYQIEKQIIKDINQEYNVTGRQHRKLKTPGTNSKRRRDMEAPSFDVFDQGSNPSMAEGTQTKSIIQNLSEIGKMASSGSMDLQMEPYYSPDEYQDMDGLLDIPKSRRTDGRRSSNVKQEFKNQRMLPELVDFNQQNKMAQQRSSSSLQHKREKAYYGNAVKNPVLKQLASPTRKQVQVQKAGRPDYEANYLGKVPQKYNIPKVDYQQFMPKSSLLNQSPEISMKKHILKNKANLRDVNKVFIQDAVKEQQRKKAAVEASRGTTEKSYAPLKSSKIQTTSMVRRKPLIETPLMDEAKGPPSVFINKESEVKVKPTLIQTVSPRIQKKPHTVVKLQNPKDIEIQILEPTDTKEQASPKTPKYSPIPKSSGKSHLASPIKIVNDSIELRGSTLVQEQEMKIFDQQNKQALTPRVLKKSQVQVHDEKTYNPKYQTPQLRTSKFTPKVIDSKLMPGVRLTLQSQNRANNQKGSQQKYNQTQTPQKTDIQQNQRVNDLIKSAIKSTGPTLSKLKDSKPVLQEADSRRQSLTHKRSKPKYFNLKDSDQKLRTKNKSSLQKDTNSVIRPWTSSKIQDEKVAVRKSPPMQEFDSPEDKNQWVSMVSVIITDRDNSENIELSPSNTPSKNQKQIDQSLKLSLKKLQPENANIYRTLRPPKLSQEIQSVQMFEKGSASSGSRRQSIIQTLSKQEVSARDQKKKVQGEYMSVSPKKPVISKFFMHQKAQTPTYVEEHQTARSNKKSIALKNQPVAMNQGNQRSKFNSPVRERSNSSKLSQNNLEIHISKTAPRHRATLSNEEDQKIPYGVNETLINDINKVASKQIDEHYKEIRNFNKSQASKAVEKTTKGIKISLTKIIQQRNEQDDIQKQRVELSDNYYMDSVRSQAVNNQNLQVSQGIYQKSDRASQIQGNSLGVVAGKEPAKKPWSRKSLDELKQNIVKQIKDLKKNNQERFELLKEKQQGD